MAKEKTGNITAAYVRCSTVEQNDRLQRKAIRAWAKASGIENLKWYSDKASGTTNNRPEWKKLQQAIDKGKVSAVICWRLDRLSRSLKDAANLFDRMHKRGIRLVSVTEGVDLDSISGKMIAGILAVFAEFENAVRRQRQKAGIEVAKAAGKKWGGSQKGWSMVSTRRINRILDMYDKGISKAAIARAEELSWPTVHKIIEAVK
ncbi:MAG: recombinase family protein [Phycisphaerae bacterium]|nr:recombinase family protein [Phycisphaerae bacterium]